MSKTVKKPVEKSSKQNNSAQGQKELTENLVPVSNQTFSGSLPNLKNITVQQVPKDKQIEELNAIVAGLNKTIKEQRELLSRSVEMTLQFQDYIPGPPVPNKEMLYEKACSGDGITVRSWMDQWLEQLIANNKNYDFKKSTIMSEHGKCAMKPCIIAGSGPSLKRNIQTLKQNKDVMLVSCLHNFAYFEDNGVKVDYYVNLDAGDITADEMSQGGKESPEHYWKLSKKRTLVSVVSGNPKLLKMWRGDIKFFSVAPPDKGYMEKVQKITDFNVMFNVGGNTLGACLYLAKAILGANPIAFIGADFCFDYTKKFHPFDSPYDKKYSGLVPCTDVFGNRVYSWQSYVNFKAWFDYEACGGKGGNPGIYINCTEGGILGAYPEGNIQQIQQWSLAEFLQCYTAYKILPGLIEERWKKKEFCFLF
jgi:hypothetical protein